jgi:hypothetical protein
MTSFRKCIGLAAVTLASGMLTATSTLANPTLKGSLPGVLDIDPNTGFATFDGGGHLTLMGKVTVYGEFDFVEGEEPDTLEGVGIAEIVAANGDVLVADVVWDIDADGNGDLEFRWPGEVTFSDGTTVESTGRFVELPFAGLRGTSTTTEFQNRTVTGITMTGEIVDPDPLDT